MADKKATEATAAVPRFSKAQLMAQVDELIEKYLKGKVI